MEDKLKKLRLTDNEIKVYLCVLENTKITPALIARKTGVTRPTAYSVGKSLIEKGFIEADELSPTLYFVALPPENIGKIVKKEKIELEEKLKTVESLISELSLVPKSKNYSVPKVKFIDETHFEEFMYERAPIWNKSGLERGAPTWWGFQDHNLIEYVPEWFKWYFNFSAGKIDSRLITNVEEKNKINDTLNKNYQREAKYWAGADKIKVTYSVLGDYILIANTQTKPHYLVEIQDSVIAENLRQIFKGFWEMLPGEDVFLSLEDGDSMSYNFKKFETLDAFWGYGLRVLSESVSIKEDMLIYNPHDWFLLARESSETELFNNIKASGRKIKLYCSGNKPLDNYISKYFDNDFKYIQTKNRPFTENNYYVNVFSDYIIEVFFDEENHNLIEDFYSKYSEFTKEAEKEIKNIILRDGKNKVVISRDKKKAEEIKKILEVLK